MNTTNQYFLQIKYWRALITTIVLYVIVFISIGVLAVDADMTSTYSLTITYIFGAIYLIVAFPFIYIAEKLPLISDNEWGFYLAILTGCIFYSLLIELAAIKYQNYRSKKAAKKTQ